MVGEPGELGTSEATCLCLPSFIFPEMGSRAMSRVVPCCTLLAGPTPNPDCGAQRGSRQPAPSCSRSKVREVTEPDS